tara:strand:+ start:147 stop:416 length:270 start_codon:yes stop_codon:yes gene_type:complete
MPTKTDNITFRVKEVDKIYEISGCKLKKALNDCGMTQAELSRACGYQSSARVCHLIKGGKTRISGKPLKKILKVLEGKGISVVGYTECW